MERESLTQYTKRAIIEYGSEVIEERALPDFRDGLKPVQRYCLFAMHKLKINSSGGFKKAARIVGDVIGKYHPHGDTSTYLALVGLAGVKREGTNVWNSRNSNVPLVEGTGNWGTALDDAAAYRYTEARLSKLSDIALLDPIYMECVPYINNYDETEKMPLFLPAKLPIILLNGFYSIGVGIAASSPPFEPKGVLELVRSYYNGTPATLQLVAKHLRIKYPYGGSCLSTARDLIPVFKGKGSARFSPEYIIDDNTRTLTFTSLCPGVTSTKSMETFMENLSNIVKGVGVVAESTDKKGFSIKVTFKKTIKLELFDTYVNQCLAISYSESYDLGVTVRELSRVSFKRTSVPELLNDWCAWRIQLENQVLDTLINRATSELRKQNLLLQAMLNLEVIIAALKVKKDYPSKDGTRTINGSAVHLMKTLKWTEEQAMYILKKPILTLRRLEEPALRITIKDLEARITALKVDRKDPRKRLLKELDSFKDF
jgi:DNA gyrase/topoisomerase IV subunit A